MGDARIDAALAEHFPFAGRWLELDGARLHYVDEGAGPPVLMVHGNPSWSLLFRGLIAGLRGEHRVIAPDHVGCGLSDKPDEARYSYTLRRRGADLGALIDRLDLSDLTLVVHDWGGMIGLAAALERQARIARLVILNTAAFLMPAGKRLPWTLWFTKHVPGLPALLVQGLNAFARGAARWGVVRPMPADVRAAYLGPYDTWHNRLATLRFVQDIPISPADESYMQAAWVDEHLAELADRPTLICWGERDFVFDLDYLAEWQRRFPAAEVRRFPSAGHYLPEDEPDGLLEAVRGFLPRTAPVAAGARK
ncbi:MAG TPA: alpha/beta fold hydrolase [Phycisphaerae bacterium]|nr:alpha/beta fold hydrolase [Phycisphaerae bacterium]